MDNKEQLTIKHLSPQIPFGVKCYAQGMHVDDYAEPKVPIEYTIIGIHTDSDGETFVHCDDGELYHEFHISDVFPLMYSLDSLTKEIEVNGERFVPIERLAGLPGVDSLRNDIRHKNVHCDMLSYGMVQKLYEWHFAIDIPSHLYIDLNTINK